MITIGGLQKLTLIDFPGNLACTIFLSGCNFKCPWCYSRELVLPQNIKLQPKISQDEVFDFLAARKNLLGGVVICGGEPTIHEDLAGFIEKIKKMNFLVKLDTNGSNPQALKGLIAENLIDYAAMDVKLPKERYYELSGADAQKIAQSIQILKNSKIDSEFRTTVVPSVHTKKDIIAIAKWISPAKKYYLQNFRPEKTIDPEFEAKKPFSDEDLLDMQKAVAPLFETCRIR